MADDDDFGMGGIENRDGYAVASAAGELSVIEGGAKVLKAVSAVAGALWILAVVFMFWNWYDIAEKTSGSINFSITAGSSPSSSVLQALATTLGSTWGYLLVRGAGLHGLDAAARPAHAPARGRHVRRRLTRPRTRPLWLTWSGHA